MSEVNQGGFKVTGVSGDEDYAKAFSGTEQEAAAEAAAVETEDAAAVETQEAATEQATEDKPTFDVKAVFGEGFETFEDVKARLDALSKRPDIELDDELLSLAEAKKQGWSIDEYLRVAKANYDEVSDADVVKMDLRKSKAHLTQEEIDVIYNDKYGFDEEADDASEVARRKVLLKDAAFEARSRMKEFQKSYKPPKAQAQEVQQAAKEAWKNGIEQFNVEELVVSKGDNEVFRYKVDPSKVAELKSELSEMDNYFKGYIKDGQLDMKRLATDRMKARLFDDVVASASATAASKGREEVVERRNNVDTTKENRNPTKDNVLLDLYQQARKAGF